MRDAYFGHYRKLVYLAQTDDPQATAKAEAAAARLGLAFERRFTGLFGLESFLHAQAQRMARLTILYWRDIPSQVIVKAGRKTAKRELPERFIRAIDAAAMRSGAQSTDAYLADWRRADAGALRRRSRSRGRGRRRSACSANTTTPRLAQLAANEGREP